MSDAKVEANVEGIGLLSFRVIWFVLAGFVLGFTTSTIWEWLYYRQRRRRLLEQHQQTLLDAQRTTAPRPPRNTENQRAQTESDSAALEQSRTVRSTNQAATPERQRPAYRSSGIFLESERKDTVRATDGELSSTTTAATGAPATAASSAIHNNETAPTVGNQVSTKSGSAANLPNEPRAVAASAVSQTVTTNARDTGSRDATSQAGSTTKRAADHPDNLANIKGIGEAYKRRLYATGIYTWRQLAESDTETLRRITRAKPNADIQSWQTQARELAETEGRWDANFQGPLDDFTRIEGIGAITADILYRFGICTYEQLAATNPDELARIVPAPTVGNENDFDGWIRDAAQLAQAKARNGGNLL